MGVHILHESKGLYDRSQNLSASSSLLTGRMSGSHMRLWKSRSKSQSRLALAAGCCWTSEGRGCWRNTNGQQVELKDFPLLNVSEVERLALQRLALSKLSELNLGCPLEVPKMDNVAVQETKKRPMLLRKKAATTNFFESKEKKGSGTHRPMFGIPLTQCITNDKMRLRTMADDNSVQKQKERQNHCEEVLSALRISHKNLSEDSSVSSREGSQTDIRMESSVTTQHGSNSRKSISDFFSGEAQVPFVVKLCIQFLETKALRTLGIFRVSGSQKRIRQLREDLENDQNFAFDESTQPHDVAELLKEFFRDLPEPLLTRTLYRAFIAVQRINTFRLRLKATRWLLYLLPVAHRDTLAALLTFLAKVSFFSEDIQRDDGIWVAGNKMDSSNLATVFGPNLLRARKGSNDAPYAVYSSERAQERSEVILTVRMLIENYETLFQVPPEDLDAIFQSLMVYDPQVLNVLLYRHLYPTRSDELLAESSTSDSQLEKLSYSISSIESYRKDTSSSQELIEVTESKAKHLASVCSVEANAKRLAELNLKSRIRPLVCSKEESRNVHPLEHHRYMKDSTENLLDERRQSQESSVKNTRFEPFAITATFTVKLGGKSYATSPGTTCETAQGDSSETRRVTYKRYRHKTTPTFVSEEDPISITIPLPKHIANVRKPTGYFESARFDGNESKSKETIIVTRKSSHSAEREKRGLLNLNVDGQVSQRSPSMQERWKRKEIIASEYIQL